MITLPNADYCPRCGSELTEKMVEDKKRLYCNKCDETIWRNPKVASGMFITRDNEVLLIKRGAAPNKGTWSIPAGFVEWSESPDNAAVRELEEETGLTVEKDAITADGNMHIRHPDGKYLIITVYNADLSDIEGSISAGDDADDARFWELEKIKNSNESLESETLENFLEERI